MKALLKATNEAKKNIKYFNFGKKYARTKPIAKMVEVCPEGNE